jgi:tRNA(fMet)-specific endonuclease VapC
MSDPRRVLLDTNVVIALFAGVPTIVKRIEECSEAYIPVTVLGELYHGALQSVRQQENLARLRELATRHAVLPCVVETARRYGRVRTMLAAKGRPIPENDIWIAALAMQHELTLLTRDRHFREIEDLTLDLLD